MIIEFHIFSEIIDHYKYLMMTIISNIKYINSYGLKCYDVVEDTVNRTYLPSTNNTISESKRWNAA